MKLKISFVIISLLLLISCTTNKQINGQLPSNSTLSCNTDADCIKAGCSGTLCLAKSNQSSGFTTCEWKPEYQCYVSENCICKNNECAWDNQTKLTQCLGN